MYVQLGIQNKLYKGVPHASDDSGPVIPHFETAIGHFGVGPALSDFSSAIEDLLGALQGLYSNFGRLVLVLEPKFQHFKEQIVSDTKLGIPRRQMAYGIHCELTQIQLLKKSTL